jgi:hypothetical protein
MHYLLWPPKRVHVVCAFGRSNHKAQYNHKKFRLKEFAEHCPWDNVVFTSLGFCVFLVKQ